MLLPKKKSHLDTGLRGEELAIQFLRQKGYKILERNYRKKFGEVDIIAFHQGEIVFIEVKTRRSRQYGNPFEAVGNHKQRQLVKIAQYYIIAKDLTDAPARFDVVGVQLSEEQEPQIDIITNAFELAD